MPASSACLTMLALRVMSSYEELVQDPIRLAVSWLGQPFSLMESANCVWAQHYVDTCKRVHCNSCAREHAHIRSAR